MRLQQILDTIKNSKAGECLVVFDLDSTLYDLTLRVKAILDRFAKDERIRSQFPEACDRLANIKIERTDWGLIEPLRRIGILRPDHNDFISEIQSAWSRGFFSNEFLKFDFPLPGAVTFVEHCIRYGGEALYLTGRDVARMGIGTETSLKSVGFPLDGVTSKLQLKPDASLDDAAFKAEAIYYLAKKYRHVWLFENEPVNINAVLKREPSVKIIFVDTCHSGLEQVSVDAASIEIFSGQFQISESGQE